MRTTVAIVTSRARLRFEEVRARRAARRRGAGADRGDGLCHTASRCGTSLPPEMFPRVFGHEGAGVVEEVGGDVSGIAVGDHVVLSLRSCRACGRCERGQVGYCENSMLLNYMGMRMDGSTPTPATGARSTAPSSAQSSFAQHARRERRQRRRRRPSPRPDPVRRLTAAASRPAPVRCSTCCNPARRQSGVYGVGAVGLAAIAAAAGPGVGTIVAVDLLESRLDGRRGVRRRSWSTRPSSATSRRRQGQGADRRRLHGRDRHHCASPPVIKQAAQAIGIRGELVVLVLVPRSSQSTPSTSLQNGKVVPRLGRGRLRPARDGAGLLGLHAAARARRRLRWSRRTRQFTEIDQAMPIATGPWSAGLVW